MLIRIFAIFTLIAFTLNTTSEVRSCFTEKCESMMHSAENFECDSCPSCIETVVENNQIIPSRHLFLINSIIPVNYLNLYHLTYSHSIYRPPIA
jgi:hypothetical protein